MSNKKSQVSARPVSANRPAPVPSSAKAAAQFPGVGMTLGSYKHSAFTDADKSAISAKPARPNRFKRIFRVKFIILFFVLILLGVGGFLGFKFARTTHKLFHGNIFSVLTTTKLKGEAQGRVNILLAGNSADDPGHGGADLTDSIMIMSIDTKNNQAFLLSVPRDLYVNIPSLNAHQKINDAYVAGQNDKFSQSGFPNGGMGELEDVVNQDFGITINYYALVNYAALKDAVNAVGGIDVTIASDDPRGIYDPSTDFTLHMPLVKLTNGVHHLDGEHALDLARARGDAYGSYGFIGSDFTRTGHQRDMLIALKSKAVTAGVLSNPAKLSSLADAIGNNVTTDFKLSEVHRLYDIMKNVNGAAIKSYSLNSANGKNLLANYTSPEGQSTLIPAAGVDDFSDIQTFMNQITSSNPVVQEGAAVVALNATPTVGLATNVEAELDQQKFNVVAIGNAKANQATTTIIDASNGKYPNTEKALLKYFGAKATVTTVNPYSTAYNSDFIVLVGADQVPTSTTSTSSSAATNK